MTDDDDELVIRLRGLVVPAGDLDAARIRSIQARAHAEMRPRMPSPRAIGRILEPVVVAGIAAAQLAWAWSVVVR
ncbi:MAG: hypothetical protein H6709_06190 [Kofleriaceae bacterium]|nr:hypothetical protein [Myxococcales bacterium]MCB9560406.1 hypothetical protein [Kofleriaceae bacterium]MCB9571664.1 hypothetical protein [Kofleriaceae bacterium]